MDIALAHSEKGFPLSSRLLVISSEFWKQLHVSPVTLCCGQRRGKGHLSVQGL